MEYLQKRQFSRRYYLENVASAVGGCANLGQTEVGDRKTYDIRDKAEEADDTFGVETGIRKAESSVAWSLVEYRWNLERNSGNFII